MARSRDISKVLSSNSTLATDAEVAAFNYLTQSSASTVYQTKAGAGLTLLTPASIANTSGTASIGANGTITFSAVSVVSLNDLFSSTYDNYRIVIETTASSGGYLNFKLRASNSDNSAAEYGWGMNMITNGGSQFSLAGVNVTTGWSILRPGTGRNSCSFDVYSPNIARATMYTGTQSYNDGATVGITGAIGGNHSVNTAFTGFTLLSGSTITGTVSVYGYNK
jgi:hypothetical protein